MIERAAGDTHLVDQACKSAEDVSAMLTEGCDILVTLIVPGDLSARAPALKWMQLYSAGADHIPAGAVAPNVKVTTASGIHGVAIAEIVFGMMLSWTHRVHISLRAQIKHEWLRTGYFMSTADELRGKTIGIIGYGSIGRETARMAQALGMTVLALKRNPEMRTDDGWQLEGSGDPEGKIPRRFFGPEERDAILAESDFIVVTLPLSPDTRKFVGAKQFAAMKPGAYLVNIGRGEVIDEQAMIEALQQKRIAGAGLDVFEREPLPEDSPLWDFEEVILTPHMAGGHRGYTDKACELFAENLRRFRSGAPLLNLYNPTLGY